MGGSPEKRRSSCRLTKSPVRFLHGPLCTTLVSKFFISSIMHQSNHRALISIVPKVALPKTYVDRSRKKPDISPTIRRFPIHVVLDFNLLYPTLLALWIICLFGITRFLRRLTLQALPNLHMSFQPWLRHQQPH